MPIFFIILSHCLFQFWSVQETSNASNDFQVSELFSILFTEFGLLEVWTNRALCIFHTIEGGLKKDYVHGPLVGTGCSPPFLPLANTARIFLLTFFCTFFYLLDERREVEHIPTKGNHKRGFFYVPSTCISYTKPIVREKASYGPVKVYPLTKTIYQYR